jgi:NAD(P)-dependent dehydrogenase (short-subunit alcohol dehydrogenase family)
MARVWFITGISRGIGRSLAEAALAKRDYVVGTTRDGKCDIDNDNLTVLALDVKNAEQVESVVVEAFSIHKRLDVVVNNAGFGLLGAVEEVSSEEAHEVFAVNFFGALNVIQSALPFMRRFRSGHIVNISSIAGLAPGPGTGLYAASKFALEGMSQSLKAELEPLGIKVTVVEPGAFRTDFLSQHSIRYAQDSLNDYEQTSGRQRATLEAMDGKQLGDPDLAARVIIEAVESDNPPLHLLLGSDAVRRMRAKVCQYQNDIDTWERHSLSTDIVDKSAVSV